MFCKECGRNIGEHKLCPYCHTSQVPVSVQGFIDLSEHRLGSISKRSRYKAGFLQIFLGSFGIGRFYLGYKKIALFQIAASLVSFGTCGFLWGFIDGIMIIGGKEKYDGFGKLLQ